MAEPIPSTAPVAPVTPAPEPVKSDGGIDGLMSSVMKTSSEPATKPTEGDTPPVGEKPPSEQPKGDQTQKPTEPKDDDDSFWEKAPPKFKNAFHKFKRTQTESVTSLSQKIKDLEAKPVQDPKTLETIKALEKEREDLRKEVGSREDLLRQSDYQRSSEFKDKYMAPIENAYKSAVREVKNLTVRFEKDGEEQTRPATEQDFVDLINLGYNPSLQDEKAEQMFGRSAHRIIGHINKLIELRGSADNAIANANKTFEENQKQMTEQQKNWKSEYTTKQQEVRDSLPKKFPDFFGQIEGNKEANDALASGYSIVDGVISGSENLTPAQRAEKVELIRSWAAFFPRAYALRQQDQAKIRSLETELKKYRGTDPGEAGNRPASGGAPAKVKGIDEMLNAIEK